MERRFALFLALTLLIWSVFIGIQMWLAPPPQPVADLPEDDPAGEVAPAEEAPPAPDAERPVPDRPEAPRVAAPRPAVSPAQGTLGSLDPSTENPYKLLVHWNNRGAAIERVELVGYWAVDHYSGHLGHLALTDAPSGGALVNIVGPGTAAAIAGLVPGDVIQQIDELPIVSPLALENYLEERTRPGQTVALMVQRQGAATSITLSAQLTRRPLEIVKPEAHIFPLPGGGLQAFPPDPLSLLLTLDSVAGRALRPGESELTGLPSLYNANWEIEQQGPDFVEFSFTLDEDALAAAGKQGRLKIVKRYTLASREQPEDPAHHVDLRVTIENLGDEPQQVGYRLDGPTGLPLEGWWYSTKLHPHIGPGAGARDIAYKQAELGHELLGCPKIFSEARTLVEKREPPLLSLLRGDRPAPFVYLGVDTQFFASAVMPQTPEGGEAIRFRSAHAMPVQDVTAMPKKLSRTLNTSFRLATTAHTIEPGEPLVHEYRVFFGPKDSDVLASYGLSELMEYGWAIFKHPARLLQGILNFLYGIVGNFGLAIILLTVLVRMCMVPISLKQARAAAKMQELAPEMAKIKQKHPDDPMKQHQAMQELYKKHNFNPFGGCLLVFIQLPIFIGLYRCLSVDIDLRDASFIPGLPWAANLAGPDKLFYWESWMPGFIAAEFGWLGPYFNILPIATVALFLLQQKMFMPPPTDEQTRLQQQMMTYMMVFMGFLFFKVPAGLCVYFITSSLWGIAERKMLPKSKPKDAGGGGDGGVPAVPEKKPTSPNGHASPPSTKKKKRQRQR